MQRRSEHYGLQFRLAIVQAEAVRTLSIVRSEKCYMCQSLAFSMHTRTTKSESLHYE